MGKLIIQKDIVNPYAQEFCHKFIHSQNQPKYLFGRNVYADDIVKQISIDGFIDDFSSELSYMDIPIYRLKDVPKNALVLVLSGGSTQSALQRVRTHELECLDYFSFFKYSSLPLKEIVFNEGFEDEFSQNRSKFEQIYALLNDEISKDQFARLVNFKLSYNLDFLNGFKYLEDKQYFEDFLDLQPSGEVFADVGGFDGFTSEEFIKLCPQYSAIHFFEPDQNNIQNAKNRLKDYKNITFYELGLSNQKAILHFDCGGSTAKIAEAGDITIHVDRLDNLVKEPVTFIKMDIEGAEQQAIEGATDIIRKYHPKLAISVYHKAGDFWQIPEQILNIRQDYSLYLRHYTESIYETVMFFIPKNN